MRGSGQPKMEISAVTPASGLAEAATDMSAATTNTPPPLPDTSAIHGYPTAQEIARIIAAEQNWLSRLSAHLERRKRYPKAALAQGLAGDVRVRFVIAPDGTILAPELSQSSGIPEFDQEALDLLQRASPAPKPPPGANTFVTVPISFSLKS